MKKITQTKLEEISVNKVKDACNNFSKLQAFVGENDKTPSFDGQIVVRQRATDKKEDIQGYIDIQVKSTQVEKFTSKEISYQVDVADLKNFLRKDGTMFFVVEVISNTKTRIFYASLLPYDLNVLINDAQENKKKTKARRLKKLDTNKLFNICKAFIIEKENQKGIACITSNELKKFENFKIPYFYMMKNPIRYLLNNDIYLRARSKETKQEVIINKINVEEIVEQTKRPITINGKEYYPSYEIIYKRKDRAIKIGKSITLEMNKQGSVTIALSGSVYDRIRDLEFILDWNKNKAMCIGSTPAFIEEDDTAIAEMQEALEYFKNVKTVLDCIGIKCDYDFNEFNSDDKEMLNILINTIVYQKNAIKMTSDVKVAKIKIGHDICAVLVLNMEGTQKVFNYFDLHNYYVRIIGDEHDNKYKMPCYSDIKSSTMKELANFKLTSCEECIKNSDLSNFTSQFAVNLFLEMLHYYDSSKNPEHLECCKRTISFMAEKLKNDISVQVNLYQTIKRERALTYEEKEKLRKLARKRNSKTQTLLCISILLDNYADVEYYYGKLTKEETETFNGWPIRYLMNE